MINKLAGHLPLQAMLDQVIRGAEQKLAAAENVESRNHRVPAQESEKTASAVSMTSSDEVEKLASALEFLGEKIAADGIELGTESKQGGEVLPTMKPVGGKQAYGKDGSKKHSPPMRTGEKSTVDNPGPANAMETDDNRAPGGNGAKYPAKGVLKTASDNIKEKLQGEKSASVSFLLNKIAESTQGGMVLTDDKVSAPVPSNPGRELIANNSAPVSATKANALAPIKKQLSQVLTEPAMSKSTDNKVHENLRNASKGGVKIAAARAYLQKIAEEGCTCSDKGECRYCKMKKSVESKKSE